MKQQSAIDFMTSYGFAILVIIIAIVIIYEVGFGSVYGFTQNTCTAQSGFSCDYVNMNASGLLTLKMSQSVVTNMHINGFACSSQSNSTGTGPEYGNTGVTSSNSFYPSGDSPVGTTFYGSSEGTFYIYCYGVYGKLSGEVSKPVIAYIFLNYTPLGYQPTTQLIITYDGAYT